MIEMGGTFNRTKPYAIVREISSDYDKALSTYFGTSTPDVAAARGSHSAYIAALRAHGTEVEVLPELSGYPDCCFVEDAAVILGDTAIILAPGHPSRSGEVDSIAEHLSKSMEIVRLEGDGRVDGGDVVFLDDTFLIGKSTRTDVAGIEALTSHMKALDFNVDVLDVPSSTLHLTTVCSSPRAGTLLYSERDLRPESLRPYVDELIPVPPDEAYAANTLGYPDDRIIIAAGYPETRRRLLDSGFSITSIDMEPIKQADGSLTCLSVFTGLRHV